MAGPASPPCLTFSVPRPAGKGTTLSDLRLTPLNMVVTALRHHGVPHDDEQGLVRVYPGLRILDPFTDGETTAGAGIAAP